ncbi:MBL fold metallo-hydrolase [Allomuricauda sp. d1]|uniref:MBL fold metallo-hydrolase n=1 Tax=Allomuricauda sp. d1 TaxID=3136725 RepID=UPI0031D406FB
MQLYPIETGNFKLDGGAMFGVVPKSLWNRTNPSDANNMIELAMRCLLIEDGDRLILIDNGLGNKQSEKFFGYYHLWGDHSLDKSLKKHGFHRDDITDVFMTHLHFDHCGGSIQWNKDRTGYEPAFKNARFWTNEDHWQWALEPNQREKASFLKENLLPMQESGQLNFIKKAQAPYLNCSDLDFGILFVNGHTEKQMLPHIKYKGKTVVFVADLIPTVGHIPLPYVMGYDMRPLVTLDEKGTFLNEAAEKGYVLFFEHDAHNEMCTLKRTEKGVRLDQTFKFEEVFAASSL